MTSLREFLEKLNGEFDSDINLAVDSYLDELEYWMQENQFQDCSGAIIISRVMERLRGETEGGAHT